MKTQRRHKVQSWKGLVVEVWNYWGVKLHWQPRCCFSISWRAPILACSVPYSPSPFSSRLFFCPHHTSAWVWPFLCRGCIFIKRSNDNHACLVFMVVRLCFLDQSCRAIRVVHFCSLGGREQKVQQANIRTLIHPEMPNCSPAALITSNQSQGG